MTEQLIACKAPSYRWLDLSGVLASSAVAELRGNDAVSLAQLMDSVAATLDSDAIINNDGNSIVADLKAVDVRPYIPIAPSWNLTIPAPSPT